MMREGTEVGVRIEESGGTEVEVEIGADREETTGSQREVSEIQEEIRLGAHEGVDRLISEMAEAGEIDQTHKIMTDLGLATVFGVAL